MIPEDVERFLTACIPSVAHLESLLLLRGEPAHPWTVELLAARLFISPAQAAQVLADLIAAGLASQEPTRGVYRYHPSSDAQRAQVDLTAETYRTRLVAVTQHIHAQQSSTIQAFADAFRIRRGRS